MRSDEISICFHPQVKRHLQKDIDKELDCHFFFETYRRATPMAESTSHPSIVQSRDLWGTKPGVLAEEFACQEFWTMT